jgi:hypothetical protein
VPERYGSGESAIHEVAVSNNQVFRGSDNELSVIMSRIWVGVGHGGFLWIIRRQLLQSRARSLIPVSRSPAS